MEAIDEPLCLLIFIDATCYEHEWMLRSNTATTYYKFCNVSFVEGLKVLTCLSLRRIQIMYKMLKGPKYFKIKGSN